jgi:hypothetical protein
MRVGIGKSLDIPGPGGSRARDDAYIVPRFPRPVPGEEYGSSHSGIDVHKKLLVVVVVDVAKPDVVLQHGKFGTGASELSRLAAPIQRGGSSD